MPKGDAPQAILAKEPVMRHGEVRDREGTTRALSFRTFMRGYARWVIVQTDIPHISAIFGQQLHTSQLRTSTTYFFVDAFLYARTQ